MKKCYKFKINMLSVNMLSIIILVVFGILFYSKWVGIYSYFSNIFSFFLIIIFMYLWMCLHEILHAVAYRVTGTKSKNITFGIAMEMGVFYCLSKQEIGKRSILISLITPFVVIGIFTLVIGILFSNSLLCFLSIINISGASGDLLMFFYILKLDNDLKYKELDDPTSFVLITSQDLMKVKEIGVKLVDTYEYPSRKLDIHDRRKFVISKWSIIIFIMFIIFMLFLYFSAINV